LERKYITSESFRNIGFDFIFNKVEAITGYGNMIKDEAVPYVCGEEDKVNEELSKVDMFINCDNSDKIARALMYFKYIYGTLTRVSKNVVLDEIELFEIKNFMFDLNDLIKTLKYLPKEKLSIYEDLQLKALPHIYEKLDPENQKVRSFYIYDHYSKKLEKIRKDITKTEIKIKEEEKRIKEKLHDDYAVTLNLRNEVTVKKSDAKKIELLSKEENLRASGENYLSVIYKLKDNEYIDEFRERLDKVKRVETEEEYRIREELSQFLREHADELFDAAYKVGRIDYLLAKATYAKKYECIRPILSQKFKVDIKNGKNLKLAETLRKKNKECMPVSLELYKKVTCITGANMGGKTVSMRMVAQIVLAASYGMYVPAEYAEICLFNHIHISVGDDQSIEKGLSTFGAEIVNLKFALETADDRSLILIDELAGGTNPKEGFAITKATVEYLKKRNSLAIFTTHYDNIANDVELQNFQVSGLKLPENINGISDISQISKYMDYTLVEVKEDNFIPKDAINIAKLAGIPVEVIAKAEELVK